MKHDKQANKAAPSPADIVKERHLAETFVAYVVGFEHKGTFSRWGMKYKAEMHLSHKAVGVIFNSSTDYSVQHSFQKQHTRPSARSLRLI